MKPIILLLSLFLSLSFAQERMKVASLHPLMTDLLRQIGGKQIILVEIAKEGFDVHNFEPDAKDIRELEQCRLIIASGKNIEIYLSDLMDALKGEQYLVELGNTVPSQKIDAKNSLYACCPNHAAGQADPHWWHNAKYMARAAKTLGKVLAVHDPRYADLYKKRAAEVRTKYKNLHEWIKTQVATIPEKNRRIVSAHAAFGYFCQAYGFKASYVKGLSGKAEISAKDLADTIRQIKEERLPAIFPEVHGNKKMIYQIAKETGCKVGAPLVADGHYADYEKMMRDNVKSLLDALKQG